MHNILIQDNWNRITLVGHVATDPIFKTTQTGVEMAQFSLETLVSWQKRMGERGERVERHKVNIYGERPLSRITGLKRGDLILLEGHLTYLEGQDRFGTHYRRSQVTISGRDGRLLLLLSKANASLLNLEKGREENPPSGGGEDVNSDAPTTIMSTPSSTTSL